MISEQQDLFAHLIPQPRDLERLRQVQAGLPPNLHLGTTSWTNPDWEGLIYPPGTPSQDYLEHYAKAFGAVEIDSTWYRIPSAKAVEGWQRRVPEHFHFAVKVPRLITHERNLVDCQGEMEEFLGIMRPLGSRLGPLLLQFEDIARGRDAGEHETGSSSGAGSPPSFPTFPPINCALPWRCATPNGCAPNYWSCCATTGWPWP